MNDWPPETTNLVRNLLDQKNTTFDKQISDLVWRVTTIPIRTELRLKLKLAYPGSVISTSESSPIDQTSVRTVREDESSAGVKFTLPRLFERYLSVENKMIVTCDHIG